MRNPAKIGIGVLGAAGLAAAIWTGMGRWQSVNTGGLISAKSGSTCCRFSPGAPGGGTLNPSLFQGDVREAYLAAIKHPDVLAQLHCYCGCDRELGHRNLLDCFRDRHAAECEICKGEAILAAELADRGTSFDQIVGSVRARYSHGG